MAVKAFILQYQSQRWNF